MKTYESHELTAEMTKPTDKEIVDEMAQYLGMQVIVRPPYVQMAEPDDYSRMKIEEAQAAERIREREAVRPIVDETP